MADVCLHESGLSNNPKQSGSKGCYAPINVMPAGGEAGQGEGI